MDIETIDNVLIFYSIDDEKTVLDTVKFIQEKIKVNIEKFSDRGHFTDKEFPELLNIITDELPKDI